MTGKVWATIEDGNIEFVSMKKEYLDECLELVMDYYFKYEKMSQLCRLHENSAAARELLDMFRATARHGLCLVAVDKSKQKVVGCEFLSYKVKTDDDTYYDDMLERCTCKESRAFVLLEMNASSALNLFDYLNIDCYVEIEYGVTLHEYKRRGILRKLTEIALDICKRMARGESVRQPIDDTSFYNDPLPKAMFGICTSPISRNLSASFGFQEIKKLTFADISAGIINCDEDLTDTFSYEMVPLVDLKSF